MGKVTALLKSRKFWASVVGLLVSVGVLNYSDAQQAELVAAILVVVDMGVYMFSVAYEDAHRRPADLS